MFDRVLKTPLQWLFQIIPNQTFFETNKVKMYFLHFHSEQESNITFVADMRICYITFFYPFCVNGSIYFNLLEFNSFISIIITYY